MSQRRPNFLLRLWLGFWRGLTAFRIAVFNILFLLVLALIIKFVVAPGGDIVVERDSTLVLAPHGMMVEQYTGEPLERLINDALGQSVPETRLRDFTRALERAADDDNITQVLIHTDRLWGIGPGMLTELRDAVAGFKQSGKMVYAYGSAMAQGQYFLASLADEIWLDPEGFVLLEGYGRYRNFYKEGLDMLEVDVNLFRVGEYKSAMEPYIRNDMSDEAREAASFYLTSLWQDYLDMAAMQRGMPVELLARYANEAADRLDAADGDTARMALEGGLVDRLVSRPEMRAELARTGAPDDNGSFRQIAFDSYLQVPERPRRKRDQVGVIVAQGVIMEGRQSPGSIGADSTSALIRQAAQDDDIKAVVLRVDSPGGSAFASEVIRRELMALKDAGKPVVISMGNVAASGGYWISMGADEIWAYPSTITGSIGIFGFLPTFQDTLAKIGIHTDGVGTTPLAGGFRADRALPEEVKRLFQTVIEAGYRDFISLVAQHRGMSLDDVDAVSRGRVWSGVQAQQRGLVDHLGTLDDAVAAAARRAGLGENFDVSYVEPELSAFEAFLAELTGQAIARMNIQADSRSLLSLVPREMRARIEHDLRLLSRSAETLGGRPRVMAHCLCAIPD